MLDSIFSRVRAYGRCPEGLSRSAALSELLAARDLYSQEPQNLARYDPALLRVAAGSVEPKDAKRLLRPEVSALLANFRDHIELPPEAVQAVVASATLPRPDWDPTLSSNRAMRHDLFRKLLRIGVLGPHSSLKASVGLFFVKKKSGDIRMVVDARVANALHRRPPRAVLGTAASLSELDLGFDADLPPDSDGHVVGFDFHGSAADVRDGFYQFSVRE